MCSALDNRVSRGRYLAGVYVPAADFHFILIDYHFRSHPSFRVFAWNAMHPSDRLHHRLLIAVRTCEYYGNASIAIFGEGSIVQEICIMRQQNSLLTPCERENILVAAATESHVRSKCDVVSSGSKDLGHADAKTFIYKKATSLSSTSSSNLFLRRLRGGSPSHSCFSPQAPPEE